MKKLTKDILFINQCNIIVNYVIQYINHIKAYWITLKNFIILIFKLTQ